VKYDDTTILGQETWRQLNCDTQLDLDYGAGSEILAVACANIVVSWQNSDKQWNLILHCSTSLSRLEKAKDVEWTIILCATARLVSFDASRALTRKQEQDEILRFEVCGRGDWRGAQIGGLPRRVSWTLMQWSTSSTSSSGGCCCCCEGALPSPASRKIRPATTAPRRCGGWFRQVVAPTGGGMATGRGGGYLVAADARARRRRRSPWWRRRLCRRE
jgi:hypothetical protein